ncbi:MAG: winged helix-turn-helix domain-containing protein [Vicinamibacterales bacterium]
MGSQYFFGPFALDAARRQLTRGADAVPLTARGFDVLLALLERRGETVEKDQLLQRVWPDTIVEEANLSQQIFTIRKLLGQTEGQPYIATVPRRGYRFVAAVREGAVDKPAAPAPAAAPPAAGAHAQPVRLAIPLSDTAPLASIPNGVIAISPDGLRIVYAASAGATTELYLRPLSEVTATPIPGTEGASNPFFSPDGEWLGFQCGRRLQKLPLAGGPPITLCEVSDVRGASWGTDGHIVYAPGPTSGLWRVHASGGSAAPLTIVDFDGGERTHRWPHVLPGGRGVIFTVGHAGAASFDEASLAVADSGGAGHRMLLRHATDGRYVPSGYLVWARGATLFAAPFDLDAREITAAARVVQPGVAMNATGVAHFTCASTAGLLVHVPGEAQSLRRSLVGVDRTGAITAEYAAGEALEEPRVSPDGRAVVVSLRGRSSDLWRRRFGGGTLERVTFEGENFAGIWGPEPGMLTFSSSREGGASDIYCVQPDRASPPELLIASEFDKAASSWSPDGSTLLFTEYHPETGADIWVLDRHASTARPFLRTRFNEYAPVFSPDGRLVVYTTDESGRPEIHALSYPDATGKRQLSVGGGAEPVWSRDGRELFYRSGDRVMRVDMSGGVDEAGVPETVLEGKYAPGTVTVANYDVSADGGEFLMVKTAEAAAPTALHVTLGWPV